MPSEEEGVRAFQVRVGCYSGGRYGEEPRWIEREGRRTAVRQVDSRWQEPDRRGWRLTLEDGTKAILYHVQEHDLWSVVEL